MRLAMLAIVGTLLLVAAAFSLASRQGYATQNRSELSQAASRVHLAGTDELGRDRAARLSVAILLSLGGACVASAAASALAVALGIWASSGTEGVRAGLLYVNDLFLTLPWLFLLMLVRATLPLNLAPLRSGVITFGLLTVLGAPSFLRIHQQKTSGLMRSDWFLQAKACGLTQWQLYRQLLPHLKRHFWTQFLLFTPAFVIAEANMGALGLGLSEPLPSLGTFLASLQSDFLFGAPTLAYLPIAVLIIMLIAMELLIFGETE